MTQEYIDRFLRARKELIRRCFASLNSQQQEAVLTTEGPLLLLAGAGSGKTTVLINRIANLLRFGCGSDTNEIPDFITEQNVAEMEAALAGFGAEDPRIAAMCAMRPVAPWNVIAITFTNKAANELKERLQRMLGSDGMDVWAMTFHSACCKILRKDIDRLGYNSRFTIYDTADSERVMKDIVRDMNLDEKVFAPRMILAVISKAKDKMQFPAQFAAANENGDYRMEMISKAYTEYAKRLKDANALDFDDIILLTVKLLQEHEDIRTFYQKKFRYVLVDEYQDTNHLQYLLTSLLAGGYENICVVGDDDQSIYKFRGATIENILSFEQQYHGTKLIRLEQNYRSTKAILEAANAVIRNNLGRKGKRLWTENADGEKVIVYEAANENDEANFVAGRIFAMQNEASFKDFAVLYRTNAQSNALERSFKFNSIPYRIIGGTRFFDRAEIKDMLAYLWVINNRADDLRLLRIINNPPRGIGQKTIDMAERQAASAGVPIWNVISQPHDYPSMEKSAAKLKGFTDVIERCAALLGKLPLPEVYDELLQCSGYVTMLEEKNDIESRSRLENIRELRSSIVGYVENHPEDASLSGFLEEIALYTDIEQYDASADAVVMMTMHAAKGLEFPHVFIVGAEEGLFPSLRCIGEHEEMEEERRLCYVAITRAKKTLAISYADQRMLYGHTMNNRISRFVEEIPQNLVKGRKSAPASAPSFGYSSQNYDGTNHVQQTKPHQAVSTLQFSATITPQKKTPTAEMNLRPGDMVEHKAYGRGMVISSLKMGNDALLEIAFDEKGTKKLMANTASIHMKKL